MNEGTGGTGMQEHTRAAAAPRGPVTLTAGQEAALARLGFALERPGSVAVLCGPAGTGTTGVLDRLEACASRSCRVMRTSLRDWHDGAPVHPADLLIADDAHAATADTLGRFVRLVRTRDPATRLVLAGRGRLFTLLSRDVGLESLVTLRAILHPFSPEQTAAVLSTTCAAAGVPPDALAECADTIHEIAGGIPATIVALARVALVIRSSDPARRLVGEDIELLHRRVSLDAA